MRIKIVEPGWDGFSDFMGSVKFTHGVSDEDVPEHMVNNIAASIKVVEYRGETATGVEKLGGQLGFAAEAVRRKDDHAPVDRQLEADKPNAPPKVARTEVPKSVFTFEQLAAIADKGGIKGLREIGGKLGVNGRDINGLIASIIKRQDEIVKARKNAKRDQAKAA